MVIYCGSILLIILWKTFYLSVSSWQFRIFSPSESSVTPESCRSLLLRSSSLRTEFENCKTDDKLPQDWAVRLHMENLNKRTKLLHINLDSVILF